MLMSTGSCVAFRGQITKNMFFEHGLPRSFMMVNCWCKRIHKTSCRRNVFVFFFREGVQEVQEFIDRTGGLSCGDFDTHHFVVLKSHVLKFARKLLQQEMSLRWNCRKWSHRCYNTSRVHRFLVNWSPQTVDWELSWVWCPQPKKTISHQRDHMFHHSSFLKYLKNLHTWRCNAWCTYYVAMA